MSEQLRIAFALSEGIRNGLRTMTCRRVGAGLSAVLLLAVCGSCRRQELDLQTVVVAIESSPNNLDPRIGTDAQSERIGGLIFDALVRKDEHFEMRPWVATSWEQPDALTWIFHLRDGIRFHDNRPLTAEDVAWTIMSMVDGTLITAKGGAFAANRHEELGPSLR